MAPPALRVKGEKMRGQLRDNDGKIVIATDGSLSFSDDDNLSIRSMDSSRDEMFNSPFVNRPKPTAKYPLRLEGIMEGMRNAPVTQYRNRNGLNGYATVNDTPDGEEDILHPNIDWLKQFAVVVQKRPSTTAAQGGTVDSVRVRSPPLMRFLSEHLVAYPEYANPTGEFPMKFNAPMTPLFHAWDAIVKSKEDHPDPITREHVKILHDVLVKDFDEPLEKAEECRLTGRITYQYLWTVFKPGNLLYRQYPIGKDRTMKLTAAKYGVDADNAECYILDGEWVCWDGNRFGLASASNTFYPLDGVMNIAELHTMPFDLHPDREAIKARLLKRGQAYAQLTRTELKVYTGPEGESPADDILQAGDRIVVNPVGVGYKAMPKNLIALHKENIFDKRDPSFESHSPRGSLRRQQERSLDLRRAREKWARSKVADISDGIDNALTEEQILITPPYVAVFDLTRKSFDSVGVGEIGDVPWNEDMYEDLVLPEDEKDLLLSITKCHVDSSKDTDPTSETKGKGIVICLNGPKGSGKAMAVEAVAEKLHMPLYNINIDVANINGDCQRLDDVVYSAFERARKWNIAMVFHNIDFLLSDANDGSWNHECVALLAHDLTTHPAPVFFTTSKIRDIDPFLRTHFDLTLHLPTPFPPLASRRQMWENALSAAVPSLRQRHRHFTTEQLDQLAETELSGREIKSVVKMAVMLARGKGEAFGMGALERVLRLKEKEKEGEEDGDAEESEEE